MTDAAEAAGTDRGGILRQISDTLFRRPFLLLTLLLAPPMLWLGIVYLGSLLALLAQSWVTFLSQLLHQDLMSTGWLVARCPENRKQSCYLQLNPERQSVAGSLRLLHLDSWEPLSDLTAMQLRYSVQR